MKKLFVIKIGGNIIDNEEQLYSFLNDFSKIKEKKILVHGGGKIATELSERLGLEPKMVDGKRITDKKTLEVVQMVYGGLINKNIVARLQAKKCNAVGITGADVGFILAQKRLAKIDYGFVGDVKKVNIHSILSLLKLQLTPVIAPLTHDGNGQILNTNADTIAAAIAMALATKYKVMLVYCFEKPGVLQNIHDENSVIERIRLKEYLNLKKEGIISKGMIPKLDNAFDAVRKKVKSVVICHAMDLRKVISGKQTGTQLEK